MARKSRKQTAASNASKEQVDSKIWSAGLYARISVETEEKREADTIGTQIQLLRDFSSEHEDISVFDVYCDDNISGTSFARPEFSRLMNDVRDGRVNCIIVKDLSRLGRNYLESGEYIEMVFPFFGVRFIAVTDGFDTKSQQADISVQLKNLMNESYARDISKKISSAHRTLARQGKFTASHAPYGYARDPKDKYHLIPDPKTAPVVREIFQMVAEGNTLHYVATTLNARGVASPGRYLYEQGLSRNEKFKTSNWYMPTVRKTLKDTVYLGWITGGKYRSQYLETGVKGTKKMPQEEWIVTKGVHEPLVTQALFDKVQEYFVRNAEEHVGVSKYNSESVQKSLFRSRLRCGECGKRMTLRYKTSSSGQRVGWYICPLHDNYNSSYCPKKGVKQSELESHALRLIKAQMKLFVDTQRLVQELNQKEGSKTKYRIFLDQLGSVQGQIERYLGLKASLYEDFKEGLLSQEDYLRMGQEYAAKVDELRIFEAELQKEAERFGPDYAGDSGWAARVREFMDAQELSLPMVEAFIEEMALFNDGHVEVKFSGRDELDELLYIAATRRKELEKYAG